MFKNEIGKSFSWYLIHKITHTMKTQIHRNNHEWEERNKKVKEIFKNIPIYPQFKLHNNVKTQITIMGDFMCGTIESNHSPIKLNLLYCIATLSFTRNSIFDLSFFFCFPLKVYIYGHTQHRHFNQQWRNSLSIGTMVEIIIKEKMEHEKKNQNNNGTPFTLLFSWMESLRQVGIVYKKV